MKRKVKGVLITLPINYYDSLKTLKERGIISSFAEAARDALIEWFDKHTMILSLLAHDDVQD